MFSFLFVLERLKTVTQCCVTEEKLQLFVQRQVARKNCASALREAPLCGAFSAKPPCGRPTDGPVAQSVCNGGMHKIAD
jgi:hypothetical protein